MTTEWGCSSKLAFAAFGLASRITGDEDRAIASIDAARRQCVGTDAEFLRAVRLEARERRPPVVAPETAPRPAALAEVSYADWAVLDRVAYRGMSVSEAAEAVGIERREALARLRRGLAAAGTALRHGRQAGHHPEAARGERLGGDLTAGGIGDPAGDGEAETAPLRLDAV
jgi:hypothetical protein